MNKELPKNTQYIVIGVSVILVIISFGGNWASSFLSRFIRELLLVGALIFIFPVIIKSPLLNKPGVIPKLKNLLFLLIAIYAVHFVSALLIGSPLFSYHRQINAMMTREPASGYQQIIFGILSYLVGLISVIIGYIIYQLTLYRRKKWPANLMKAAVVSGSIAVGLSFLFNEPISQRFVFGFKETSIAIFYGLTFLILLIVSFKNSWVNYLNKRQKLVVLLVLVLFTPVFVLVDVLSLKSNVEQFSLIFSGCFSVITDFVSIYLVLSIFSILLHLPTAGLFDRKVRQLSFLQSLIRDLTKINSREKLYTQILVYSREIIETDIVWYLEWIQEKNVFSLNGASRQAQDNLFLIDTRPDSAMNSVIIATKKPYVVNGFRGENEMDGNQKLKRLRGSLIGIPLLSQESKLMGILFAFKSIEFAFDNEDIEVYRAFANQIVTAFENINLHKEALEKERLKQELRVAREVQLRLLPKELPEIAGNISMDAFSLPAMEVGGDYYDFVRLSEHEFGVIIGDVSGKGTSAAFYMAEIKGVVQSLVKLYRSPRELLKHINTTIYNNIDRRSFITLSYMIINNEKKTITFARAGHSPLVVFSNGESEAEVAQRIPRGIGLGLDKKDLFDSIIEEEEFSYKPGDLLFLYTDGATDAFDAHGNEFGEENVINAVAGCVSDHPSDIRKHLLKKIKTYAKDGSVSDDITLIFVKISEPEEVGKS